MMDRPGPFQKPVSDYGELEGVRIIYEDNHLLLVDKPAGLPCQAAENARDCLVERLRRGIKERDQKPGAVYLALLHRLDQPVGGLMMFAKTSKAAGRMSRQLRGHAWDKHYLAVSQGILKFGEQHTFSDLLLKDTRTGSTQVLTGSVQEREKKGARQAILDCRSLASDPAAGMSLLAIQLGTGRSHQIRVQLASRGLPIWADYRYNKAWAKAGGGYDIALRSVCLAFTHPVRQEKMAFFLPPPRKDVWVKYQDEIRAFGDELYERYEGFRNSGSLG